jgi:hypothetical protein
MQVPSASSLTASFGVLTIGTSLPSFVIPVDVELPGDRLLASRFYSLEFTSTGNSKLNGELAALERSSGAERQQVSREVDAEVELLGVEAHKLAEDTLTAALLDHHLFPVADAAGRTQTFADFTLSDFAPRQILGAMHAPAPSQHAHDVGPKLSHNLWVHAAFNDQPLL